MACQLSACIGLIINTFRCKISKHEATKQVTVGDQTTANKSIRETGIQRYQRGTAAKHSQKYNHTYNHTTENTPL